MDGASGYTIPTDNPFATDTSAAPEIWSYGLRNPWRFSFDRINGDLYIGDVGQDAWEEVDYLTAADFNAEFYLTQYALAPHILDVDGVDGPHEFVLVNDATHALEPPAGFSDQASAAATSAVRTPVRTIVADV